MYSWPLIPASGYRAKARHREDWLADARMPEQLAATKVNYWPGIPLGLTPAAISREVGEVDVFVCGEDKAVWHRAFAAGWQGWQTLGGGFNTGPGAASWHRNKMVLAAVGLDNQPWLSEWTGSAWTPWESLDGSLTSLPSLACWYGSDR